VIFLFKTELKAVLQSCHREDRRQLVGVNESSSVSTPLILNSDNSYLRRVLRKENDKQQNEKRKESTTTRRVERAFIFAYVHSRMQNVPWSVNVSPDDRGIDEKNVSFTQFTWVSKNRRIQRLDFFRNFAIVVDAQFPIYKLFEKSQS